MSSLSAYELRVLLPSKKGASQDYLYYNADAPVEDYDVEVDDASRAGPATRSSSSADDGEPPSKKPKPRFNAHGKYTTVENELETELAQAIDMDVTKAELEAYQRRPERQITSPNGKVDVAQAETASVKSKAAKDVASTAAAKDREPERLQKQLADAQRKHADAQRKHAAAMDA